ncbi:polyprenyl synthetase family protein [Ruminococcus sp. HUN007]|uniref:polyprenyl synthetase family protein n=1 Tax=Ruminococcus sp. HUN007 TaxID=1514668 RepID=UPI0006796A41|nr:farnesyl diphosphate synthase [Ruminococcus sp. HUN007]
MEQKYKDIMIGYIAGIEKNIRKYTEDRSGNPAQNRLTEAMRYSLEAGGKRIRPVLVTEFCRLCGGSAEMAAAPAAAIEMIHTASLIHDDLPAMDNDDFRRGRPSCHKAYTEAEAILAGDALIVLPFQIIAEDTALDGAKKARIISDLAASTAVTGMIGGQAIDIDNETRNDVDEENLRYMYSLKTGALIRTSARMGCIAAGASEEMINRADEYAKKIGLAFQIIDDILDVTSTTEELGKPVGSDEENNKTTFVTVMGIEKAKEEADRLTAEALDLLDGFEDSGFLKALTNELLDRRK